MTAQKVHRLIKKFKVFNAFSVALYQLEDL
jgi:hypothetical protein